MAKINFKKFEQKDLIDLSQLILALSKANSLEGVGYLTAMIISYAQQHGTEEALTRITEGPSIFLDLVKLNLEKNLSEEVKKSQLSKVLDAWSTLNTEEYIEKLKLTRIQAITLHTIYKNKNQASLADIKKVLKRQGYQTAKNGSMVGGSIAGLSKKCEAYGIPKLIKTTKGPNSQDIYSFITKSKKVLDLVAGSIKPIISSN